MVLTYLLAPNEAKELDIKDTIVLKGASLSDALQVLKDVLEKNGIGMVPVDREYLEAKKLPPITLNLVDQPLPVILSRYADVFGKEFCWDLNKSPYGGPLMQFFFISNSK